MTASRVLLVSAQPRESWLRQRGRRAAAGDLGIRALAAWLRAHGIHADILPDWRATQPTLGRMVKELGDLTLVGISAHLHDLEYARASAARVRQERPDIPVVLGGYLPTFAADRLLAAWPEIDCVVRGEGEHAILSLAERLLAGRDVSGTPGLAWRGPLGTMVEAPRPSVIRNLDELPLPLRTRDDMPPTGEVMISASRGCYGRCSFCSVPNFNEAGWRGRSPARVASEMAMLAADFGATFVNFVDDSFFGPGGGIERAIQLRDELRREKVRLPFRVSMRANDVDIQSIEVLKEAGLAAVQLGVESFSERQLLWTFSKGVRPDDNRRAIDVLERLGVHVQLGLILFEPGTTLDDLAVNAAAITRMGSAVVPSTTSRLHCADGTVLAHELTASGRSLGMDGYLNHRWVFEHPEAGRVMRLVQAFEAPHEVIGMGLLDAVTPPVRTGTLRAAQETGARYQRYKHASFGALAEAVRCVGSGMDDDTVLAALRDTFENEFSALRLDNVPDDPEDLQPRVLHLELTNRCNLACTICANSRMTRLRGDMSIETFEMILSRIDEADIEQVILNTVGETLMYTHLDTVIRELKRRGLVVLVSTNGQILDEAKARILLDGGCDVVRVSVNAGEARSYEAMHKGGRFDRLVANIGNLVALRNGSGSLTTVRIRAVLPREPDQAADVRISVQNFWASRVDQVEFVTFGNMGGRNGAQAVTDERRVPCTTIWRGMNILLDGRVSWCPCDFDADMVVGSLWTRSLREIWEEPQFMAVRRSHRNGDFSSLPWCERCDATRRAWYEKKRPAVTNREAVILDSYLRVGRDYMGSAGRETE